MARTKEELHELFYGDKSDWYDEDSKGQKNWNKSEDRIEAFWKAVREEKIDKEDYNFSKFVFPVMGMENNVSFGKATFSGEANFEKARFSGEANFEKARFSGEANFVEATFSGRVEKHLHGSFTQSDDVAAVTTRPF